MSMKYISITGSAATVILIWQAKTGFCYTPTAAGNSNPTPTLYVDNIVSCDCTHGEKSSSEKIKTKNI